MAFPNVAGKHDGVPVLTPAALLAHRTDDLGETLPAGIPTRVVMTYQPQLLDAVRSLEETTPVHVGGFTRTVHALDRTAGRVGVVGGFGIGAPAAAVVLEELVSLGCDAVVSVGAAGGLVELEIGDLVVCEGAVRDEGVSHHYLAGDVDAVPDRGLTDALAQRFERAGLVHSRGRTWTIDALFRETVDEVRHHAANGVATVDMEAAALFVVAAHRGVDLASAFCVSDLLTGAVWEASFDSERLKANMWNLLDAAIDVLDEIPDGDGAGAARERPGS
ncbi:nucleoside phosphorylase [Ilumatobacter sp.]|uniref:nucleoside phosphorylase n=1 Tax=Ilumatobacter sp. TaxID=1967498 RepID=UPI003B5299C8